MMNPAAINGAAGMPSAMVTLSREELFRLVWETPLSRLAETYGITGNGLAKICNRLSVPYPPRGHWAKKAAGKKLAEPKLPPLPQSTPNSVTIRPTPLPPERAPLSEEQQKVLAQVERMGTIKVSERLYRPHRIIARWVAEHERERREAKSRRPDVWARTFTEWTDADHRRHRILDALFKAAERSGLTVNVEQYGRTYFSFGKERIDYKIREKQKQVNKLKNEFEMRFSKPEDGSWKKALEPTGFLVFKIDTYLGDSSIKCEWVEDATHSLESMIGEITKSLALAGPALVKRRTEREEAERQIREREHLRELKRQERQREQNRWRRFRELAQQWKDSKLALEFLDALEAANLEPTGEIGGRAMSDWLQWARDKATETNPLSAGPAAVFDNIGAITSWTYRD